MNVTVNIPYGKKHLKLSIPKKRLAGIVKNKSPKKKNIAAIINDALLRALTKKRIEQTAAPGSRILIVVPDATRKSHLEEVLPLLIKRINSDPALIDIIIATGMHQKHTSREISNLVGAKIARRHNVMCHLQDGRTLKQYGQTSFGVPVILSEIPERYDYVISVGVVEPHLYAGFSGGAKTVAIGLAGEKTISATHNVKFLDNANTKIGMIKDNPFQDTLWEIASYARIDFCLNIVNDADGNAIAAFAGNVRNVFERSAAYARRIFEVGVKKRCDIAVCGIGYPKDVNLYQASRAVNYILNVKKPIIKKGGILIIAAELKDGIGHSTAEQRFYGCLKGMRSPENFIAETRKNGCSAGEHRAFMVAKPLSDYEIVFVTARGKAFMKGLPFGHFDNISEAVNYAISEIGPSAKLYVVPRALSTIAQAEK